MFLLGSRKGAFRASERLKFRKLYQKQTLGSVGRIEYKRVELADCTLLPISQFLDEARLNLPVGCPRRRSRGVEFGPRRNRLPENARRRGKRKRSARRKRFELRLQRRIERDLCVRHRIGRKYRIGISGNRCAQFPQLFPVGSVEGLKFGGITGKYCDNIGGIHKEFSFLLQVGRC